MDTPIAQLALLLSSKVALAHCRESLTPEEIQSLWELQANLVTVLPPTEWLGHYVNKDRR